MGRKMDSENTPPFLTSVEMEGLFQNKFGPALVALGFEYAGLSQHSCHAQQCPVRNGRDENESAPFVRHDTLNHRPDAARKGRNSVLLELDAEEVDGLVNLPRLEG